MNVDDFLDEIGDILQEDFTYAVLWTKAELFKYLKLILREFSGRTLIRDKNVIRIVNGTTGEADLPEDFNQAYYTLFNQIHVDTVPFSDLDFEDSDWIANGTGTPSSGTIIGAGTDAKVKFVPVPSSVSTGVEGTTTSLGIKDTNDDVWDITFDSGVITTTIDAGATPADYSTGAILKHPGGTKYQITIATTGVLSSTASSDVSDYVFYLIPDDTEETAYHLRVTAAGLIETINYAYGTTVRIDLDGTNQTMDQNYGVIVNAFVGAPASASVDSVYVDGPLGTTVHGFMSENSGYIWYKGLVQDPLTTESALFLSGGLRAIVTHGVLSMAFGKDGEGRDSEKAELLRYVFELECEFVKNLYQRKK